MNAVADRQDKFDWPLMLALLGLMVVGAAFIYSATAASESVTTTAWYRQKFYGQLIFFGIGCVAMMVVALIDYHSLARWAIVGYWGSIGLLLAVLVIGVRVYGAKRWINLGITNFQPSELAKIALIFALAHFLSRPVQELRAPSLFWKSLGMTILPFVLILKEPDLGSALILLPICLATMFVAGVPPSYIKKLIGGTLLLITLVLVDIFFAPPNWPKIPLDDYQKHRLLVYFNQDFPPRDDTPQERRRARELQEQRSYQVKQALISVGSGGFWGKGWRQSTQVALSYLPRGAAHNDFIFSVIAEETGFVGSVIVLGLYGVVLFSGIRIASQARDRLGKLLAVGVVTLFFSHVFINIGMNIRLMPVTGVPLPLLSHGGSSVVCSLIAAGILQNVYIHRRAY